jgi:hypothetical protein
MYISASLVLKYGINRLQLKRPRSEYGINMCGGVPTGNGKPSYMVNIWTLIRNPLVGGTRMVYGCRNTVSHTIPSRS